MRHSLFLVAIPLIALPGVSAAQVPADSLVAGDLVQYELSGPWRDLPEEGTGRFGSLSPSVVTLSTLEDYEGLGPVELPRELVDDFEVARGTKNLRWFGAAVGGALGLAIGLSAAQSELNVGTLVLPVLGPVVGGGFGYLIGSQITGPRWEDVQLRFPSDHP